MVPLPPTAQNPEIMVYISNTQLEMLNQYAKLLEEKHFYTWEKAKRTDTKIQIAYFSKLSFELNYKMSTKTARQHGDEYMFSFWSVD